MRATRAVAAGVSILMLHGGAQAAHGQRWAVESAAVRDDPTCAHLRKEIDVYFRRYPAMPDACVEAALGGAFEMPALQPVRNPSLDFTAHIEKYLQVGASSYFADLDRGIAPEDMYEYRAEIFARNNEQMLVWRGPMADQFSPYGTVPGKIKTILQIRRQSGGCDGKPEQKYVEENVLMAEDMSGPLRLKTSVVDNLLANARMRMYQGAPVFISGPQVFRQTRYGLEPMCSFKRISVHSR
jgi:hypothetical protein